MIWQLGKPLLPVGFPKGTWSAQPLLLALPISPRLTSIKLNMSIVAQWGCRPLLNIYQFHKINFHPHTRTHTHIHTHTDVSLIASIAIRMDVTDKVYLHHDFSEHPGWNSVVVFPFPKFSSLNVAEGVSEFPIVRVGKYARIILFSCKLGGGFMFLFIPIWGNDPILLIFFKWVESTNY